MSQIISDDFNRADAANLGANWTDQTAGWDIVSNQAKGGTGGDNSSVFTGASWTGGSDHYAEAAMVSMGGGDGGPTARALTTAETFFVADVVAIGTGNHTLYDVVAGGFTSIGSATFGVAANDVVRIEAQGSTIRLLLNGVQKVTGTGSRTTGKPGLFGFAQVIVDNFAAGDFGAAGVLAKPPVIVRQAVNRAATY